MSQRDPIPVPALLLGWAGVVPFAVFSAASLLERPLPLPPLPLLLAYAAAILSFMGGAQWGLTVRADTGRDRRGSGYAASVLPALLAWVALLLGGRPAIVLLLAGFATLLAYDLFTVRHGWAPPWYGRLRFQLTGAVVILLGLVVIFER